MNLGNSGYEADEASHAKLIPIIRDGKPEKISIEEYVGPAAQDISEIHEELPKRTNVTDLADYPLMLKTLERFGLRPTDVSKTHAVILQKPEWVAETKEGILAYVASDEMLEKQYAPRSPGSVKRSVVERAIGSRAMFTDLAPELLNDYSDIVFHELMHVLDKNGDLPEAVRTNPFDPEHKKRAEAEFDARGEAEMKQTYRQSGSYELAFSKFAKSLAVQLPAREARDAMKAENPKLTDVELDRASDVELRKQFEADVFEKEFNKTRDKWKTQYVYMTKPTEQLAWKLQMSFLKHEKGMSFDAVVNHLLRATGTMPNGKSLEPWTIARLRALYDAN